MMGHILKNTLESFVNDLNEEMSARLLCNLF